MPGKAKSTNFSDAMPHLLNSMGDSIERSNKMDFGTPGMHTQNGFQQPFEQTTPGPLWVLLSEALGSGTYESPSNAYAKILLPDTPSGDQALQESSDEIKVWNYSSSFSASSGDWIMVVPFNGLYVAMSPGSSGNSIGDIINFEITEYIPLAGDDSAICDFVYAVVTRASCSSSVQVGDEVLIADPNFQVFSFPIAYLVGTRGMATWMKVDDIVGEVTCPEMIYGLDLTCIWVAQAAFCQELGAYA